MSKQAVLGGPETSAHGDVDIPRSHDAGVANAAVVYLYTTPFNSGVRSYAWATPGYARRMWKPGKIWHCKIQYRPATVGPFDGNCCVCSRNDSVAAGLYSQSRVVVAKWIVCVVNYNW